MGFLGHCVLPGAVRVVGPKAAGADAVGRLAIGLGRFHGPIPRMVAVLEYTIIQEVVGFSGAEGDGGRGGSV